MPPREPHVIQHRLDNLQANPEPLHPGGDRAAHVVKAPSRQGAYSSSRSFAPDQPLTCFSPFAVKTYWHPAIRGSLVMMADAIGDSGMMCS